MVLANQGHMAIWATANGDQRHSRSVAAGRPFTVRAPASGGMVMAGDPRMASNSRGAYGMVAKAKRGTHVSFSCQRPEHNAPADCIAAKCTAQAAAGAADGFKALRSGIRAP
jgi:hypothetical protein